MKLSEYNPKHWSPSTINSFITNRAGWRASKILKRPFIQTPNMSRGKAVEEIVNRFVENRGAPFINDEHVGVCALEFYDNENKLYKENAGPNWVDKFRADIPRIAVKALEIYKDKCITETPLTQTKIYCKLPGVERQVLGILDYFWHGQKVSDCKVLSKNMSRLSIDYCISGGIYSEGTGTPVTFDTFVPLKKEVSHKPHKLSDAEKKFGLSYAAAAARCMEQLIVAEDPEEVFRLMSFPNIAAIWDADDRKKVADEWEFELLEEEED